MLRTLHESASPLLKVACPYDVVRLILKVFSPKQMDNVLSHLGAATVPPHKVVGIADRGQTKQYFALGRKVHHKGCFITHYSFAYDAYNMTYAAWMAAACGTELVAANEEIHSSNSREAWADPVEAALGLCHLAERLPVLQRWFTGDMQSLCAQLESELYSL